jgi:hypothetical protein
LSIDLINYNINKQIRKIQYHEFLNFGIFSSFELSAIENLDGTTQPLQSKSECYVSNLKKFYGSISTEQETLPKLNIVDIILMAR